MIRCSMHNYRSQSVPCPKCAIQKEDGFKAEKDIELDAFFPPDTQVEANIDLIWLYNKMRGWFSWMKNSDKH